MRTCCRLRRRRRPRYSSCSQPSIPAYNGWPRSFGVGCVQRDAEHCMATQRDARGAAERSTLRSTPELNRRVAGA